MTSLNVGSDCLPVLAKCSVGKCPYGFKNRLKFLTIKKSEKNNVSSILTGWGHLYSLSVIIYNDDGQKKNNESKILPHCICR